jgi:hypothetical protein
MTWIYLEFHAIKQYLKGVAMIFCARGRTIKLASQPPPRLITFVYVTDLLPLFIYYNVTL